MDESDLGGRYYLEGEQRMPAIEHTPEQGERRKDIWRMLVSLPACDGRGTYPEDHEKVCTGTDGASAPPTLPRDSPNLEMTVAAKRTRTTEGSEI